MSIKGDMILATVASIDTPRGSIDLPLSIASVAFPDQGLTSAEVITRAETTLVEAMRARPAPQTQREPEEPGVFRPFDPALQRTPRLPGPGWSS
jgi:hypothetical protein